MTQELLPNPLEGSGLPNTLGLLSVNDLAFRLGYERDYLEDIAGLAGRFYSPFDKQLKFRWFAKKLPKPKRRIIDNPQADLKRIQKRIETRLLRPLVFPHYLCGGVKGKTVIDNVAMHIGTRVLVTLDIKSFFPSIRPTAIYKVWSSTLGCSPPVAGLLTKLTTFERHLPQGAPTSSLLANLVLYSVDEPIRTACERQGVRYSTWVDDLAFSGPRAPELIQTAVECLRSNGFRISRHKLKIMGTGGRMILNGVLLGRFPGIARERVSQLRSGIHKLRSGEVPELYMDRYCQSLEGSIRQLSIIAPQKGNQLRSEYETVLTERNARW